MVLFDFINDCQPNWIKCQSLHILTRQVVPDVASDILDLWVTGVRDC